MDNVAETPKVHRHPHHLNPHCHHDPHHHLHHHHYHLHHHHYHHHPLLVDLPLGKKKTNTGWGYKDESILVKGIPSLEGTLNISLWILPNVHKGGQHLHH